MQKPRIYELAKELNTTSKRLMEKLAEININVKNHMSFLEDNELEALYDHIGVIRHKEPAKTDAGTASDKPASPSSAATTTAAATPPKTDPRKDIRRDHKSMPRIIRTTEVIINTRDDYYDSRPLKGGQSGNQQRKPDVIRVADANTGLRAGFVRDAGPAARTGFKPSYKADIVRMQAKPEIKVQTPISHSVPSSDNARIQDISRQTAQAGQAIEQPKAKADMVAAATDKSAIPGAVTSAAPEVIFSAIPSVPEKIADKDIRPIHQYTESTKHAVPEQKPETLHPAEAGIEVEKAYVRDEVQAESKPDAVEADKAERQPEQQVEQRAAQKVEQKSEQRPDQRFEQRTGRRPAYGPDTRQGQDVSQGQDIRQGQRPPYRTEQRPGQRTDVRQDQRPGYGTSQQPYPRYGQRPGDQQSGDRDQRQDVRGPYAGQGQSRPQGDVRGPYAGQGRPQGDVRGPYAGQGQSRPQYAGQGRPQSDTRPQYAGQGQGRPIGDRGGFRPAGARPQGDSWQSRQPDRSKPEFTQKPALPGKDHERFASRRDYKAKDVEPEGIKKDVKKDTVKTVMPDKKFKPQNLIGEKKHLNEVLSDEFVLDEIFDEANVRIKRPVKGRKDSRLQRQVRHIPAKAVLTNISLPEVVTVKELAENLKKTSSDVIKKLMGLGILATINHEIDFDTAALIAEEYNVKADKLKVVTEEDILFDDTEETSDKLVSRPPVVVVMGHVDHGKTSLLDAIRKTNVIDSEAGGITQHIGAYMVNIKNRNITFLDTPGHEAFTAMRARGAQVTDIAILVVAADDGVMPQTIEAINHAKAAKVSIIVALNKIDKPEADPEKVKRELTEHNLVPEEWGGDVIFVPVSAKQQTNIDHLLEMVLLSADVLELKANPDRQAKGTIIEAKLDKSRGPVATVLVQRGTLNTGDSLVTGSTVGRIRVMSDDKGKAVKSAGPSTPVEIVGLSEVPEAGETFYAITDEKVARQLAEKRKAKQRENTLKAAPRVSLDALYEQIKEGKVKELDIILKADVQGSVEAITQSLEKLGNDEVRLKIIHGGVGAITESDIRLAEVSNAIIIGFNVRPTAEVAEIAESAKVDLRLYRIIYDAIQDIEAALKGMLEPTFKEVVQGHTEIRQIFRVSGIGSIGGCYVLDGKISRNSDVRLVRNGIVVYEGKLASLKRFKDDAREVQQGFECGLSIEKFNDIKEGDIIESFVMQEEAR